MESEYTIHHHNGEKVSDGKPFYRLFPETLLRHSDRPGISWRVFLSQDCARRLQRGRELKYVARPDNECVSNPGTAFGFP